MKNKLTFEKSMKKAAYEVRLAAEEKSVMRNRLILSMEEVAKEHQSERQFNFLFPNIWRFASVPVYIVLILLIGSSSVYAAEGSLPGEPLYAIKRLAENVHLALSFSNQSRAETAAVLATKRLEEVETLSNQNRLDSSVVASSLKDFVAASRLVQASTIKMKDNGGSKEAIRINQDLLNKIKLHEARLSDQLATKPLTPLLLAVKSEDEMLMSVNPSEPKMMESEIKPIPPTAPVPPMMSPDIKEKIEEPKVADPKAVELEESSSTTPVILPLPTPTVLPHVEKPSSLAPGVGTEIPKAAKSEKLSQIGKVDFPEKVARK